MTHADIVRVTNREQYSWFVRSEASYARRRVTPTNIMCAVRVVPLKRMDKKQALQKSSNKKLFLEGGVRP